mmetsp:Transcript_76630/g.175728  ORF Transcript_76630/g.175728 Transcript_76630/m.175728 type:complete len:203 (-) Transcript_76630:1470-2078(-)
MKPVPVGLTPSQDGGQAGGVRHLDLEHIVQELQHRGHRQSGQKHMPQLAKQRISIGNCSGADQVALGLILRVHAETRGDKHVLAGGGDHEWCFDQVLPQVARATIWERKAKPCQKCRESSLGAEGSPKSTLIDVLLPAHPANQVVHEALRDELYRYMWGHQFPVDTSVTVDQVEHLSVVLTAWMVKQPAHCCVALELHSLQI